MRYPTAIRPDWVPLRLAPFILRRTPEPSDRDLEEDAGSEYPLAVEATDFTAMSVDWSAGLIEVRLQHPDDEGSDDCDSRDGGVYRVCVRSHPSLFRSAASRTLHPDQAALLAGLVDDFWSALTRRHSALIAEDVLSVYARGGPKPVDGFRKIPSDVWAASAVDWASGTCTSPDGRVYFSIHVARSEAPSARAVGGPGPTPIRKQTGLDGVAAARDPSGAEVMDVHAASRFLGISKSSLDKWRLTGDGPPFHRIGARVRYQRSDLEGWRHRRRDPGRPA